MRRALSWNSAACSSAEKSAVIVLNSSYTSSNDGMQAGDRKVAGEHRALRAEAVDAVEDDRPQAVERPVMIVGDEVGDLDRDVRLAATERQPVAPAPHAVGIAVDRAAAMVEDECMVRKVAHEPRRVGELVGNTIRSKTRPCSASTARPARQARVVHQVAARGEAAGRIGVPAQDVADADDPRERPPAPRSGQAASGARERHMRHERAGDAAGDCRGSRASASRRGNRRTAQPAST